MPAPILSRAWLEARAAPHSSTIDIAPKPGMSRSITNRLKRVILHPPVVNSRPHLLLGSREGKLNILYITKGILYQTRHDRGPPQVASGPRARRSNRLAQGGER